MRYSINMRGTGIREQGTREDCENMECEIRHLLCTSGIFDFPKGGATPSTLPLGSAPVISIRDSSFSRFDEGLLLKVAKVQFFVSPGNVIQTSVLKCVPPLSISF